MKQHALIPYVVVALVLFAGALTVSRLSSSPSLFDPRTRAQTSNASPVSFYGTPLDVIKVFGQSSYGETTQDATVANKTHHASGIAIDTKNGTEKIYIVDTGNNRILGFDGWSSPDQSANLIIGQPSSHTGSCNGDNNLGIYTSASPSSLCLTGFPLATNTAEYWMRTSIDTDIAGNLYVPDIWNNRVLKYNQPFSPDKTGGKGDAIADDVWGQDDFSGNAINKGRGINQRSADVLNLSKGGFDHVSSRGVSVDNSGNLWVADTFNFRVLRFSSGNKQADLVIGQPDASSPTNMAAQQNECEQSVTSRPLNRLCTPTLARVHPVTGKLYVLDESMPAFKARILVFSPPFQTGMSADKVIIPQQPGAFQNTSWNYYFQATGFSFNTSSIPEYTAGTLWVNEHDAKRTILIDDDGNIIKVIGAPDAVHKGCDYAYYNQCGTSNESGFNLCWPGGSPAFDASGNIYLADEQFHRISRFSLPYNTIQQGNLSCLPQANGGLMQGTSANSISGSKMMTGILGAVVAGNQLIIKDLQRYMVWNDYMNLSDGAQATMVIGQNTMTERVPRGLGSRSGHGVDDLNRLWLLNDNYNSDAAGKLRVYQLPFSAGATPLASDIQLYWQDDPNTTIPHGTFEGGLTFDPIGKKLWIADYKHHRLLRVSNYAQVTSGKLYVDAVLGQPDKLTIKCNNTQDMGWIAPGAPTASSLCDPHQLSFDKQGNLYVIENNYECHGNNRVTMYEAQDLANISTLFPNLSAKKVFVRNSLTEQSSCNGNILNEPFSPVSIAFDSQNHMVMGNDGYYGDVTQRAWKQLWYYCDPLRRDTNGQYVQGQKPDASIKLPMGAAGAIVFDSSDNLIVQDHTWAKTWLVNLNQDPDLIIPQNGATSGSTVCAPTPTLTPTPAYDPVNKAFQKPASSNRADSVGTQTPDKANDGDTTTPNRSWQVSNPLRAGDWWQVDMGNIQSVAKVVIYPNASNYHDFCSAFRVQTSTTGAFSGEQMTVVTETQRPEIIRNIYTFPEVSARYVRVICDVTANWIQLQEVEIYGIVPTITPSPVPSSTLTPSLTSVPPTITPSPLPSPTVPVSTPTPSQQTMTIYPLDDAYVRSDAATQNYGTAMTLQTDGKPVNLSFLKFDLRPLAGKTIISATFRVKIGTDASSGTQRVKVVNNTSWEEETVTYRNRPTSVSKVQANFPAGLPQTWVEMSLLSSVSSNIGKLISYQIDTGSTDAATFHSRESADRPYLIVAYK